MTLPMAPASMRLRPQRPAAPRLFQALAQPIHNPNNGDNTEKGEGNFTGHTTPSYSPSHAWVFCKMDEKPRSDFVTLT